MIWFYTYIHPNLFYVFIAALATGLAGYHYGRQYRAKPARRLFLAAFVLDLVMVAIYTASTVYTRNGEDAFMAFLWTFFALMSFKYYRRFS